MPLVGALRSEPPSSPHYYYSTMTDQPAIGPDGQLLDASKMEWHHDPDDARPIEPTPSAAKSAAASSAASAPGGAVAAAFKPTA